MNLAEIRARSPKVESRGRRQTAFYSIGCVWWTSFPEDLGAKRTGNFRPPFPCCPHCRSLLMEAPLQEFVAVAEGNPEHYGEHGIKAFEAAHHSSGLHAASWDEMNRLLEK